MKPDVARIDLAPLSATERDGVALLLRVERVAHRFEGDRLSVPAAERDRVAELVEIAVSAPRRAPGETGDPLAGDPSTVPDDQGSRLPGAAFDPLASPARRAAAAAAELAAFAVLASALTRRAEACRRAPVTALAACSVAGHLLAPAVLGFSPGGALSGCRVRVPPRPGPPGLRPALMRWAVADGPLLAAAAVWAAGGRRCVPFTTALLAGAAAVRAPVAADPWHRGVHDRVAGTVVTRAGARRRRHERRR